MIAGDGGWAGHDVPAAEALADAGLAPLRLEAKEGLALLNGTQMMSAVGALAVLDAERLCGTASVVAAMSTEALMGTDVAFAEAYHAARPHPGQARVAAELRHLLRDSQLQHAHHGEAHKVQDPYSVRCAPQVHGASLDALAYARRVLEIEINSATDNPLVFPDGAVADPEAIATAGGHVVSGGNFHGQPVALAMDFAKLAIAELGSISERRTALLIDGRLSGLPPVPGRRRRAEQRPDAAPVHRGRARLRGQGPRPPRLRRLDPDQRQPGGPRLDGLDRRPAGARRSWATSSTSWRSSCSAPARASTSGSRTACAPGPGSPRRIAGCAIVWRTWRAIATRGRTSPQLRRWSPAERCSTCCRPPRREHPFQPLASGA